jgi:hypothetical protein
MTVVQLHYLAGPHTGLLMRERDNCKARCEPGQPPLFPGRHLLGNPIEDPALVVCAWSAQEMPGNVQLLHAAMLADYWY